MAAAAACFEREGYRNANMRDIAAAADVAYQTLYNYFPSKARIAVALLAGDAEVLSGDGSDLLGTLASLADSMAGRIAAGDREIWREAIIEAIRNDETPVIRCLDPTLGDRLAAALGAAQQHGHLDAYLDTGAMALVIESLLSAALLSWISGEHGQDATGSLAGNIELVLKPYLRNAGSHS